MAPKARSLRRSGLCASRGHGCGRVENATSRGPRKSRGPLEVPHLLAAAGPRDTHDRPRRPPSSSSLSGRASRSSRPATWSASTLPRSRRPLAGVSWSMSRSPMPRVSCPKCLRRCGTSDELRRERRPRLLRDCNAERWSSSGQSGKVPGQRGAPSRTRTCNLRIRRPLLYPLSYRGAGTIVVGSGRDLRARARGGRVARGERRRRAGSLWRHRDVSRATSTQPSRPGSASSPAPAAVRDPLIGARVWHRLWNHRR